MITEEDKEKERRKISHDLRQCGYPTWALKQGAERGKKGKDRDKENRGQGMPSREKPESIVLPYCKGLSERLGRIYNKYNIKMHSKPARDKPW